MKNSVLKYVIALFVMHCFVANSQKNSFIVTTTNDTIYVDKVVLKEDKIKVTDNDVTKKYNYDALKSFYTAKDMKHFEKVISPPSDNAYIKKVYFKNDYYFLHRLTEGKVKLFSFSVKGLVMSAASPHMSAPFSFSDDLYFISIYDSKLEPIGDHFKLKLTKEVFDILSVYLYGNDEITKELHDLYNTKPTPAKKEIIDLINKYNVWVAKRKK